MKSSKKKTSTERKRHHAKAVKAKPAKKAAPKKVAKKAPAKVAKRKPAKKATPKKVAYRAKATPRQATPRHTERKRHLAKPSKVTKKASANTERKRHHAKPKPAKKAKTANTERQRHPAKSAPKTNPAKKVAKKVVAKKKLPKKAKQSPKAVKPSNTERKRHPAKKAKKETPKKVAKEKPSKSAKVAKSEKKAKRGWRGVAFARYRPLKRGTTTHPYPQSLPLKRGGKIAKPAKKEKVKEKPAEFFRPPKRGATGALIISKRGRKSKKERAATEAQSIFVPRDVKAENTEENQIRDARAYSPDELEQLLMSRGVSNMNVFDPKTASTAKVEYRAEAAPCHTERKRHLAKEKKQKKVILTTLPKAKKRQTVGPVSVSDLFGFNPFAKNSASQEEKLIPEKWRKYYRKLIERKDALLARLNEHSEKAFQKEGKEETGDVSAYSQHTADIDSDAFDRDVALSRLPAEQEELSEINIAIDRMKKGTYGICEITGKPIPAERLNKVPFTRYSLEGKLEAEKQRGLAARRRRANATGDISEVIDLENDAPVQLPEEENEEQ